MKADRGRHPAFRRGGGVPVAVLCGRPNVGKSTLFNAIARRRIAIEEPTAGVTRDRVGAIVEHEGRRLELVDTGGIGLTDETALHAEIARQIAIALDSADVVLLVVDARDGLRPGDREIADRVRSLAKPVVLLVNKVETRDLVQQAVEFWDLGLGEPLPCSARERKGIAELFGRIDAALPAWDSSVPDEGRDALRVAIVGRVNAGKSTLVNELAGEERCIVSEIPGTTRDSVDVLVRRDGRLFWAIDTAGIRKRRSVDGSLDFYGQQRALASIRRADVVLHVLDVSTEVTRVDRQIVAHVLEHAKPIVVALNKWDLVKGRPLRDFQRYFEEALPGLAFAPRVFFSARTGRNVKALLDTAEILREQASRTASTADVNRALEEALQGLGRLGRGARRPKTFYGTQVGASPPTFVLFVNDTRLFSDAAVRYLEGRFRAALGFPLLPLRILLRSRDAGVGRIRGARPAGRVPASPGRGGRRSGGSVRGRRGRERGGSRGGGDR